MICVVFMAETIPTFGPLLDLIGGSTTALTALIFPPLFYMFLVANEDFFKVEKFPSLSK
jgi:hypothetical protein